jgi:peroxiredoxin
MYDKYRHFGVDIVGIGVDQANKIAEFAANYRIPYPLLIGDARALELLRSLGNEAGALPYTVLLDRQGTVAYRKLGAFQQSELEEMLGQLLR